ncbi:NADH-quinone oxidoreductase subunit J [Modicisalibacter tunisiensis]|uniref:NADH-quinone oxidoreductase subunit J n=1 Tax=Modicisalibacter tunisiensis TaxID=390637 RepID=A0ABS7WX49_9GAMM|nr:NADH-quinone oxidoreductase subunit J [Modicisalibacter tunisiensis]MBZ9539894.1 NADH-quinone oxidoreductase subunit J [Modicisalibacter tunisiensis]MBZ9566709.1 NADH-quinone oxidoreductase subunit J [Modicisalibacter tunisiensis]
MEIAFYLSALVAVLATLGVITNPNPVHALLYLIISLISVAMVFFALGAPFAGALEVIVYAGAIMVLFVFVVMMLNLGETVVAQERAWMRPRVWLGPSVLSGILLLTLIATLWGGDAGRVIGGETLTARAVGSLLFGPWLLVVELAAMLLLAALVTASHVGRLPEPDKPAVSRESGARKEAS